MEKIFEVIAPYTPDSYREMLLFNCRIRLKKINMIFYGMAILTAAIAVFHFADRDIPYGIMMLVFGVFFSFYPLLLKRRVISTAMKNALRTDSITFLYPVTTTFYDDHFEISTPQSHLSVYYNQAYEAYETPENFYIYLSKQKISALPKNSFTLGTPGAFTNFLTCKLAARFKGQR